jgi:dTDP-4-dehydrorhamnose 3,5-epimerase
MDFEKQLNGMNAIGTELKDAYILTTRIYEDNRGSFTESFNLREVQKIIGPYEFVQDCHSVSAKNVVRGLHYQIEHSQGKIVRCLFGEIYDVIVDLRQSSESFGKWIGVRLMPGPTQLWVPPGFAHGFSVLSPTAEVLYKVTDYQHKEYERTLLWNDSKLNINWKISNPILSEKDNKGLSFEECDKYE